MKKTENKRKMTFSERFIATLLWPIYAPVFVLIVAMMLIVVLIVLLFKPTIMMTEKSNDEEVTDGR